MRITFFLRHTMNPRKLAVFGGNGFVGSAICRSAVARGWKVVSLSRTGEPYATAQGHSPAWVTKVDWRAANAADPTTYSELLRSCTAVVSTLGILLENDYKSNGSAKPLGVLKGVAESLLGGKGNPLGAAGGVTYEKMNRDAALSIFRAYQTAQPPVKDSSPSPFVYLSAEDIFRPFISSRYIETKREAERILAEESELNEERNTLRRTRPIFIRPSLIYHPHINPISTLPATALSAAATVQALLPASLQLSNIFPTSPSKLLSPASTSLASLLTIPPIHVDTIGEAVCMSIEDEAVRGVVGVKEMRRMLRFDDGFDKGCEV